MNYYTVDEFIAQGDRVVMVGRCGWRNKKSGATIDTPKVDILTIRDSRIVDFFELYDTAKVLAAARAVATSPKPRHARKQRRASGCHERRGRLERGHPRSREKNGNCLGASARHNGG